MKTVIEMAETLSHGWWLDDEKLERFAEFVRADEREACAKVVWEMKGQCWAYDHDTIAASIRARGNKV